MARLPQARSIFLAGRPLEVATAELRRDVTDRLCLLLDPRLAAVELEKERRSHWVSQPGMAIDRIHHHVVE